MFENNMSRFHKECMAPGDTIPCKFHIFLANFSDNIQHTKVLFTPVIESEKRLEFMMFICLKPRYSLTIIIIIIYCANKAKCQPRFSYWSTGQLLTTDNYHCPGLNVNLSFSTLKHSALTVSDSWLTSVTVAWATIC